MGKIAFRLQSAAGHQGVGNADGGGCLKLYFDVKLIIFLQKGIVNDIEKVLTMLVPVFARQFSGHCLQLLGKVIAANMWGKVKTVLQMLTIIFYYFTVSLTGNVLGQQCADVASVLCWVVAAVTAISGIKYLWDNRSFINTAK